MTSRKRSSYKRKASVLAGLEALNSFKVPKKQSNLSLLQNVDLNSVDYSEEIYPQINQSFRFPQLSSYFNVEEAWFIHNKTLEDLFSQARKRFQKNPINSIVTGVESSLCTGFLVVNSWNDVEKIASDGLIPGNDPDTWLGQQKLGLSVNQCADLTIAREQSRLLGKSSNQFLYLIMVRWIKSRAYIVSPEAEKSKDRLEPQPGYACHVSTWSRMDLLDPSKLTLEQAFHLSQVYLYEFDEDLELRTKLEHVIPYAVLKCHWKLTSDVASKLDTISVASGSILIIPPQPDISCLLSLSRTALLPTPQIPRIQKKSSRGQSSHKPVMLNFDDRPKSKIAHSNVSECKDRYRYKATALLPSPTSLSNNSVLQSPPLNNTISSTVNSVTTVGSDDNSDQLSSPVQRSKRQDSGVLNIHIANARKLQANCNLFQFSECIKSIDNNTITNTSNTCSGGLINYDNRNHANTIVDELPSTVIGVSLLVWGYPKPEYSLAVEISSFRKGEITVFDGILQPCLHIQRLVTHTSLHYELAGLQPWTNKPFDLNGPPVLVSVPRDQEWCLPRLNPIKASSLQSDPSPFGGYRGNYFRLTLHDESGGRRTEMAQLCQALQNSAMAGVVPMPCDESSIMFLFPECQFSKSIGIPIVDNLDRNFLHAILLTPHSLHRYPYSEMCCCRPNNDVVTPTSPFAVPATIPMGTSTDKLFGQRKTTSICASSMQLKLPLSSILTTLTDGGRNLLGSALISVLAHQNIVTDNNNNTEITNTRTLLNDNDRKVQHNPHLDPRLHRRQIHSTDEPDLYALATALISSAYQKKTENPTEEQSHLEEQQNKIQETGTTIHETHVETCDPKDLIPAPSSPEVGSEYHSVSLMDAQMIPKEIPLDGQTSNATTVVMNPILASSPSNFDSCNNLSVVHQNISVDMEIDNNDPCDQSSRLDKSDMEIDHPFGQLANTSPLTLKFHEPAPNPPKTTNWSCPSQLSILVSDYRRASSPNYRRSTPPPNDSHNSSTHCSTKSAVKRAHRLSAYADSKYNHKYNDYDQDTNHRSRSPSYHRSKSNSSFRGYHRSSPISKYSSNEKPKSTYSNHYHRSSGHSRSRNVRDRGRRTPRRRVHDEESPYRYSSRRHRRSPSYSDSDCYYHSRHYQSYSNDSSPITGTDSNSVTSIKGRSDYHHSNIKKRRERHPSKSQQLVRNSHQAAQYRKNDYVEVKSGYSKENIDHCQSYISIDNENNSDRINNKNNNTNTTTTNNNKGSSLNSSDNKSQDSIGDTNQSKNLKVDDNTNIHVACNTSIDVITSTNIPSVNYNKSVVDENEEGEVLDDDDDGDDCDNVNEELMQSKHHNNTNHSNTYRNSENRQIAHTSRDREHLKTRDKVITSHSASTPRKNSDKKGEQEEEDDEDSSVDPSSFQRLQVGYILNHLAKHGNVEPEPNLDTDRQIVISLDSSQSVSRDEDEYKLIDETFNSTELSDYSIQESEISLEDEDMRQSDRRSVKHYGNFYPSNIYRHMLRTRRIQKKRNDDSFSDRDDEVSNGHKGDTDYRRPPANWSNERHHRRPSLLGTYVDSSTSSGSESQPRYSFYRPRGSNSNFPKTNRKGVYSPRSSSLLPDDDMNRHILPRFQDLSSSSNSFHQLSSEYHPEITPHYRNKPRDQPLLGPPCIPIISCVNSAISHTPNPGLLPMTVRYPPPLPSPSSQFNSAVSSSQLWSSIHPFYNQTVNIYNQPSKPWQ
ncbi:unnamed protein product [Schistosoma rodhaini]|nr:unnamed protein product [Schistosoma rodhaini]